MDNNEQVDAVHKASDDPRYTDALKALTEAHESIRLGQVQLAGAIELLQIPGLTFTPARKNDAIRLTLTQAWPWKQPAMPLKFVARNLGCILCCPERRIYAWSKSHNWVGDANRPNGREVAVQKWRVIATLGKKHLLARSCEREIPRNSASSP